MKSIGWRVRSLDTGNYSAPKWTSFWKNQVSSLEFQLQLNSLDFQNSNVLNVSLDSWNLARRKVGEATKLLNECKRLDEKGAMTKDIKMVEDAIRGGGARQMQGRGARRKANRGK